MPLEDRIANLEKSQKRWWLALLVVAGALITVQLIESGVETYHSIMNRRLLLDSERAKDESFQDVVDEVQKAFGMKGSAGVDAGAELSFEEFAEEVDRRRQE